MSPLLGHMMLNSRRPVIAVAARQQDTHGNNKVQGHVVDKTTFSYKLVRSRLKWAGHVERMEEERLMKRADVVVVIVLITSNLWCVFLHALFQHLLSCKET